MYRFEKLEVWKKAMDFCELVYQTSKDFPKTELYGLTSQMRRATTSIPLNIAEGTACRTRKEFTQFLTIALRSQYEMATIIELCYRLNFLLKTDNDLLQEKLSEIGRLLQGLINSINGKVFTNNQKPKTNN